MLIYRLTWQSEVCVVILGLHLVNEVCRARGPQNAVPRLNFRDCCGEKGPTKA